MSENKKVIDQGGEYRFVPDFTTTELPGGVYYPDYNSNGEFILVESADFPSESIETVEDPPFGELIEYKEEDFFSTKPKSGQTENDDEDTEDSSDSLKTAEVEAEWTDDSYFPMQKYNPGLKEAEENINKFLSSKQYYEENDISYRRSLLFFGPAGTSKSFYVSNKCHRLVQKINAVCIRLETHSQIEIFAEDGMREVANGIPDRMKIVVFEELSEVTRHDQIKQYIVNILESRQLRENVLFLATTNDPEKLPDNFVDRPGRLDFLHGVYARDNDPSYVPKFYEHLIGEEYPIDDKEWTKKIGTELTPAYIKGLFVTAKERNESLKKTYERIKERRQLVDNNFRRNPTGFTMN